MTSQDSPARVKTRRRRTKLYAATGLLVMGIATTGVLMACQGKPAGPSLDEVVARVDQIHADLAAMIMADHPDQIADVEVLEPAFQVIVKSMSEPRPAPVQYIVTDWVDLIPGSQDLDTLAPLLLEPLLAQGWSHGANWDQASTDHVFAVIKDGYGVQIHFFDPAEPSMVLSIDGPLVDATAEEVGRVMDYSRSGRTTTVTPAEWEPLLRARLTAPAIPTASPS